MILNDTIELVSQGVVPNQITFQLNEDKSTYSVDCIYDSIKVNGEYKKVIVHSNKVSFPKDTELSVSIRENEKVWFDIIIPNDEEEKENNKMITRIFGKIIENIYDVDDKLVQITDENGNKKDVYTGKPAIKKETKVKEWYELCSYEGEPRYNHDFQCFLTSYTTYKMISISEDEEVGIEKEIFRADINESHLRSNKVVDEIATNKANAQYVLDKHIKAFNKMMIESNDKLKTYCDLHKLSYEDTDCIELFKLVFPDKLYIIRDGKMKVSDAMYVSSTALSYPSFTAPLGSIVCNE